MYQNEQGTKLGLWYEHCLQYAPYQK